MSLDKNTRFGISIVIPTFRRNQHLFHLLDSLVCVLTKTMVIEVIVVGNLKDAKTENICRLFFEKLPITYLYTGKIGANIARNLGMKVSKFDICFLVDDDCCFFDDLWHSEIQKSFENLVVTAVGGWYLPMQKMTHAGALYYIKIITWLIRYSNPTNSEALRLVGGCLVLRKTNLGSLCFDESLIYGGDETEFILRLIKNGKKLILNKKICLLHDFNLSLFSVLNKTYKQAIFHHSMQPHENTVFTEQRRTYDQIQSILLNYAKKKGYSRVLLTLYEYLYSLTFRIGKFKSLLR